MSPNGGMATMEGNIAHILTYRCKHSIACYAGDLQRSIVLLVCLVTYKRVMLMTEKFKKKTATAMSHL